MAKRRKPKKPLGWSDAAKLSGLRGPIQAVLLCLVTFPRWNSENGECWPSVPTIARGAGVCEQTARTCLQELHACGIIERVEASGYADRDSNTYWLSLPALRRRAAGIGDDDHPPLGDRGGATPDTPPPDRPPPPHAVDHPPLPDGGESSREQTREPKPPYAPPEGGAKKKRVRRETHAERIESLGALTAADATIGGGA